MALPMIMIILVVIGISIGALFVMMRSGITRTGKIVSATEHLYIGEAILANMVNKLKKATWVDRYYAESQTAPCSLLETGSYRNADFVAIIEDVTLEDGTTVIPSLSDVILQVNFNNITRRFFARVTSQTPTVLRPTNINIQRIYPIQGDINNATVRKDYSDKTTADDATIVTDQARTNIIVRLSEEMAKEGKNLYEIQDFLTTTSLDGAIAVEQAILLLWAEGYDILSSGEPGKSALAYDVFKQAYEKSLTQATVHTNYNAPYSLYLMAQARAGMYDEGMLVDSADPLAMPADDATLRNYLLEAIAHLDTLISTYTESDLVPYALLEKAKYLQKLGNILEAVNVLDLLEKDYGDVHLWGEDTTVAGRNDKDGIVSFEQALLDENGDFYISKDERKDEIGQIYFITGDDIKIRVTNDPRPKDKLTMSPDGSKISYRADNEDGTYSVITVDRDGNTLSDVTLSQGDWRPAWAPAVNDFQFAPIYYESIPDMLESTHSADLSGVAETQGIYTTLAEAIAYGESLLTTLTSAPYNVDPQNLRSESKNLDKGKRDIDAGKGDKPPKEKVGKNKKGTRKIIDAIVSLEQIKDLIDSGNTSWQTEIIQTDDNRGDRYSPPGGRHH
jgi:hypothetical protein